MHTQSQLSLSEEKGFNAIILECVDRGLLTLGEATKMALYQVVSDRYSVSSSQFAQNPIELTLCLKEILGEIGFSVLKKLIVRQIRLKFSLVESCYTLENAIAQARARFQESPGRF